MNWKVKTKNNDNEINTYFVDALNKEEVKKELSDEYILKIVKNYEIRKYKVSLRHLKDIVDEWKSLLDAGFDELSALKVVKDNCFQKKLKSILESVLLEIGKGNSLENAFYKQMKYFPLIFIEVINVSIQSNDLKNGLSLLSNYLDDEIKNKDKMKNMTLYPKIIGCLIFVVICILSKFIIPSYVELFINNDIELNKLSQILIKIFSFVGDNLLTVILCLIFFFLFIKILGRSNQYKALLTSIKRKIPFIGKSIEYLNTYMFCSMAELLWKNNINKTESLKIVANTINDSRMKDKLLNAYQDINDGLTISDALIKYRIFDSVLIKMFVIGEKNNMMLKNIENGVRYYRYKYQAHMKRTMTLLEPTLLIVMSLFVMIIILVVFIPMLNAFRMVS